MIRRLKVNVSTHHADDESEQNLVWDIVHEQHPASIDNTVLHLAYHALSWVCVAHYHTQWAITHPSPTRQSESWMESSWSLNHCTVNLPGLSLLMRRPWAWGCDVMSWGGSVCANVGLQMSNSQAELQGHSHKDKSDQRLHQRPNIPQSEGLWEKGAESTHFPLSLRCKHGHGVSTKQRGHRTGGYTCNAYRGVLWGQTVSVAPETRLKENQGQISTDYTQQASLRKSTLLIIH